MLLKWQLLAAGCLGAVAWILGMTPGWSLVVAAAAPLVIVAAPHFIRGAIHGIITPHRREDVAAAMGGTDFEDYVARIARSSGAPVIMTSTTGDWGVDIIVGRRPNRVAVQCKRQARPVGAGAIQEVVAGAPMHDCASTMVVTNHEFTPAARKLAELHGCELVGGSDLPRLRAIIQRLTAPTTPTEV